MRMPRAFPIALTAFALAAFVTGCGDDGGTADGEPNVVATTAIAADIARQVAGDAAEVTQLIPDSATPHTYHASAEDRQRIAEAHLLVTIGNGLEAAVPVDDAAALYAISEHAGGLLEDGEHDDHEGEGGEHTLDPHVWMDPTRVRAALPGLARALAGADPDSAEAYRASARRYGARLTELDQKIATKASRLPADDRVLVTSHDALGYFADRYGFEVAATPFGLSPEAEASAEDIQRVITAVRDRRVPALFVEQGDDPQVLERIADETGAEVVDDLLIENYAPIGCCYAEMLTFTAHRIIQALKV